MDNGLLRYVWIFFQIIIGYNLVLPLVLFFLFKLFGRRKPKPGVEINKADYAIIVTAYEQTELLPSVVASLLKLNYENYLIYLVADKCDISNLHFDDDRVIILRPETTLSSNTRSHFYAIQRFKRNHDRLTIIDSDNLVHPDFLTELNVFFDQGFKAVQGPRNAKNLNSTYACLDAARDIYYHYYDGEILFGLGSSATLAGSGMAFTTELYRECLESKDIKGAGFDKVLQYEIIRRKNRIAFAEQAIVYDEKTSVSDQLVKQRSRWINTWFKYFKYGFSLIGAGVADFNFNQFLFGITLIRPPLFIFLILSLAMMVIDLWVSPAMSLIWLICFICFLISFSIAVINPKTDKRIYKSLLNIPKFMFYQSVSLMRVRSANKRSVATRHFEKSGLDDIISGE